MVNCSKDLYIILRSLFGSAPYSVVGAKMGPVKVFVFFVFLTSTVLWSVYRAALTSKLVTQRAKMPFSSLEELLQSDYRYN